MAAKKIRWPFFGILQSRNIQIIHRYLPPKNFAFGRLFIHHTWGHISYLILRHSIWPKKNWSDGRFWKVTLTCNMWTKGHVTKIIADFRGLNIFTPFFLNYSENRFIESSIVSEPPRKLQMIRQKLYRQMSQSKCLTLCRPHPGYVMAWHL